MIGLPLFKFLSYPISFLFPGYLSFKAVLSPGGSDDTRWACYWVIVAFMFFIEVTLSLIVSLVPFYYEMKCVLLMVLQWNTAKKSEEIFNKFFLPLMTSVEPQVDEFINRYSQHALQFGLAAKAKATEIAGSIASQKAQERIQEEVEKTFE